MQHKINTSTIVLFFICIFSLAAGWHYFRAAGEDESVVSNEPRLEAIAVPELVLVKPAQSIAGQESVELTARPEQNVPEGEAKPANAPLQVIELPGGPLTALILPDSPAEKTSPNTDEGSAAKIEISAGIKKVEASDGAGEHDAAGGQNVPNAAGIEDASNASGEAERVVTGVVEQGDTAGELLARYVSGDSLQAMLSASRKAHPLTNIKAGQPYTLVRSSESGDIDLFEYEIDRNKKLVVNREDKRFTAHVEPIVYDYTLNLVSGTITSSLFQAIASTGENPNLAVILAEIFSSEINFIRDLRVDDSFTLLLEKRYRDGEFKNYGRVLAARFTNQGSTYEGFRFPAETGFERYFNTKGESLQKTLLKAPLSFTRVTSGYSMNRKHPVYFDRRPHQGVDYGAPTGTPVKAVGDGVVSKAGWGNGFGNMVILKHGSALESMYSHLSGFAKGIKNGVKVRQGQVIAYVGSTGVATGPHLDFRLKQNGNYVNPTKVVNPRTGPVPRGAMKKFNEQVTYARSYMDGKRDLSSYKPGQLHLGKE